MNDESKVCPFCAETIKAAAIKCRFCGSDLTTPASAAKPAPATRPVTSLPTQRFTATSSADAPPSTRSSPPVNAPYTSPEKSNTPKVVWGIAWGVVGLFVFGGCINAISHDNSAGTASGGQSATQPATVPAAAKPLTAEQKRAQLAAQKKSEAARVAAQKKAFAERLAGEAQARRQQMHDQGLLWTYSTDEYKMGGTIKYAIVKSTNDVEFSFPYEGSQKATLQLRKHPKYGKDVLLSIEKGQILTGVEGGTASVRFDEGKTKTYETAEPGDYDSTTIFIHDYDDFVSHLKRSKSVKIEVPIYQQGNQVFEFDCGDLNF